MEYSQDITRPIVERQIRLWNALHQPERHKSTPHRFLTISKDEGTPSSEISSALAQQLGWRIYDKEIVNRIAGDNRVREELVNKLDERSFLAHDSILDMVLNLIKLPESTPFDAKQYHESLLKTLVTIASHGDAIIVGRGANFALRWLAYGFHVRLTGTLEMRIQRFSNAWEISPDLARQRLLTIDSERRAFIRQHFQEDLDNSDFYTVVINTDQLSPQQIVSLILSLLNPETAQMGSGISANLV
jgi:cytidylate kinase